MQRLFEVNGETVAPAKRRRWIRLTANLVVSGVSLLTGLGAAEVMVRLAAPQQLILKFPDVWQGVDGLGWAHRAGVDTHVNTGERTVRFITDEHGFRVGSTAPAGAAARRRILLLGDSFMEAMQVEYEQSLAGLLEARLAKRTGESVLVRDTGVSNWGPSQYLLQARAALTREPLDLVLVAVYVGNDIEGKRIERFPERPPVEVHRVRWPRRLAFREWVDAFAYPVNDFLEVRSELFIFLKRRGAQLARRTGLTADYFPAVLLAREHDSPQWAVTADICKDIADLARGHGAPTLFVLLPTPLQVDIREFRRFADGFGIDPATVDLEQPNRLLNMELRRRGLNVLDLLPAFREADQAGRQLFGQVDSHFTPEGHDLAERVLEPTVAAYLGGKGQ